MNATTTAGTIEQLAQREARVALDDMSSETLYAAAMDYAKNYEGSFPFMVSMQLHVLQSGQWLTEGQAVAVLNCAVADYRYNQRHNAVKEATTIVQQAQVTTQTVLDGYYTIVNEKTGGYRTIRLQTVEGETVKQWLSYLCGPDNDTSYKSVGFVQGSEVRIFNKYAGQYKDIEAAARFLLRHSHDIGVFGAAYALRSGKCYVCARKLTTPQSIADSIGPICKEKRGI